MNIPQNWSNLSNHQVNMLLINILWNLKKYPVQQEPDSVFATGKYRINNNVTIEREHKKIICMVTDYTIEKDCDGIEYYNGTTHPDVGYESDAYIINGKIVPSRARLASMLYDRCKKMVK